MTHHVMTYQRTSVAITAALVMMFNSANFAAAQNEVARQLYVSAATVPTNIPLVHTYADPPSNFNILAATDEELATYGFPLRPDKQSAPDHYRMWERAMQAAKIRWKGELKPLPRGRGMMRARSFQEQAAQPLTGPQHISTLNWSGVVLQNALKHWSNTTSFNDIYAEITVPVSQLPFDSGSCTDSGSFHLYEGSFAGIDGYETLDNNPPGALQGGVFSEIDCAFGATYYYSYISFIDGSGAFPVNPGDVFYTEVRGFGGFNPGSVFIEDLTTLAYSSYTLDNTSSVPQVGNQAEWIVKRFCCGEGGNQPDFPLVNTIAIFFEGGAFNGSGRAFYPGSTALSTAILTMRDDFNTQDIEVVSQGGSGYQGQHSLFFQTTGCAYAGGCVP